MTESPDGHELVSPKSVNTYIEMGPQAEGEQLGSFGAAPDAVLITHADGNNLVEKDDNAVFAEEEAEEGTTEDDGVCEPCDEHIQPIPASPNPLNPH